jgi:diguanylate cyclase (GGDEF)-like protein/PAS domain S-box-containing protein
VERQDGLEGASLPGPTLAKASFDTASVGMWFVSPEGVVLAANPAAATLLGRAVDDLVGRLNTEFTHPDDLATSAVRLKALFAGDVAARRYEKRYLRPDGATVAVRLTSTVVLGEPRGPVAFTVLEDVSELKRRNEELVKVSDQLRAVVDAAPIGLLAIDGAGTVTVAAGAAMVPVGWEADKLKGRCVWDLFADRPDVVTNLRRALHGECFRSEIRFGEHVVSCWYRGVGQGDGLGAMAVATLVTEQRRLADQQAAVARFGTRALSGEAPMQLIRDAVTEIVATLGVDAAGITIDDGHPEGLPMAASHGLPDEGLAAVRIPRGPQSFTGFVLNSPEPVSVPDVAADRRFTMFKAMRGKARSVAGVRLESGAQVYGTITVGSHRYRRFSEEDLNFLGSVANVLAAALDADRSARDLRRAALHDPLTGLPNRVLLDDRLQLALALAARAHTRVGVLVCDLDRFKVVNDTLGHTAGDVVLIEVAKRMGEAVRPGDTVSRMGGDEFVVVCPDVTTERELTLVADRIVACLRAPFAVGQAMAHTGVSIGIALSQPYLRETSDHLIRDADIAAYRAKGRGRGRYEIFDTHLRAQAIVRLGLEADLHQAVRRREFRLLYQPIRSTTDGRMLGVEALLRWRHPERGTLAPADFLDIAEESGLIVPIGGWVLEEALRQTARWTAAGDWRDRWTAVNLSTRQLADTRLATHALEALSANGLHPSTLHLEVTESMLADDPGAISALDRLHSHGVRIAIDDFGTGYSSLAYLRRIPVDTIKIDRSFIANIDRSGQDATIVTAIIAMAHALDLDVTAEGVERREQLDVLERLGCDAVQGYFLARPLAAEDICHEVPTASR